MSRKGENIYYRKDGRWEGRYIKGRKPDGRPQFGFIYGKQYGDVKKRLTLIKAELYQDSGITAPAIYGNGSLESWADYWLETHVRPHVRPETYAGYRRNLDNHICAYLGKMRLTDISQRHIQNLANGLRDKMAATTLHGICRILKSLLTSACDEGLIMQNPYRNIRLPKAKNRPPRVLTQVEQKKLETAILYNNEPEYLLCLYMGLRVGELCALRWKDIDFESNILHIRHSVQRIPGEENRSRTRLVLGIPKSDASVRDIPLPRFLSEILYKKLREEEGKPDEFLFKGTKAGYRDPRTMQQKLCGLCRKLEIEDVHMHTLRHTFATRCLEKGIRYEVLCEFLGHSSPQITLKYYAHCTPETKRTSINRLAEME
ncbi:MAG: site-specific integrase [Lachnospiraceae bacterium]